MPNPDLVMVRPPSGTLMCPAVEGYRQRSNSHDEAVNEMNMTHPEACIRQKRRRTLRRKNVATLHRNLAWFKDRGPLLVGLAQAPGAPLPIVDRATAPP